MRAADRPRAPKGGYVGPLGVFEAGEFMPYALESSAGRPLSPRQIEAQEQRELRIATDRAQSDYIGEIGQRITFPVTIGKVLSFAGEFGTIYLTIARTPFGAVIVSKGAHWGREGDTPTITATIKGHTERDGVKQTVVQRVKVS